jgi:hypothetical protein
MITVLERMNNPRGNVSSNGRNRNGVKWLIKAINDGNCFKRVRTSRRPKTLNVYNRHRMTIAFFAYGLIKPLALAFD